MSRPPVVLVWCAFAIALANAGCGGGDGETGDESTTDLEAAAADGAAEPLPAPMRAPGGAVTGMPDAPGPGNVPLGGAHAPQPVEGQGPLFADGVALPVLEGAEDGALSPLRDAAPGIGATMAPGTLPPLEDNPEAGLGAGQGFIEVTRAPPGNVPDAGAVAIGAPDGADAGRQAAAAVRAYYDAVSAGDFRRAYAAWSDGGRSSGRTPEQFASSFQGTRIVRVSIGAPGRVEGAAGSRHVEVPVTVTSHTADGGELRQAGSFVMRSSVVEGAAPGWRIVSADLRELQP